MEEGPYSAEQYSTTVPGSEHCTAAKLGCRGNPHCLAKGWGKEPTCVQAPAHHTGIRTLATQGDTAWSNDLTAQPSASPREWRSKGPQVRRSSQPPSCSCMEHRSGFCLERLSRHYLPPVAASGEKDESGVRTTSCTMTVRR